MTSRGLRTAIETGLSTLERDDPALSRLLDREEHRQHETLAMVAAASVADPSVLACEASTASNVTAEGYPGDRYHAGCDVVDEIERLAEQRACRLFAAVEANTQPHSGSTANQIVLNSLLRPGDRVLGMDLQAGGHLTHGSRASVTGRHFASIGYGVDASGRIDYQQVADLAATHRPALIFCGASAYPRRIDFVRFREIADGVGAHLVADISHIAGLVAGGHHPSPVDVAHVTTTSTYKQLYGPRGGLILLGRDADTVLANGRTLRATLRDGVFPLMQGTPRLNTIAAKARAFDLAARPQFALLTGRIVETAAALAQRLTAAGHRVVTGGTDTHMVLIDVSVRGLTGKIAEKALESCGVIVNKNSLPGDPHGPRIASGVRLGTNVTALRGMGVSEMEICASLIEQVLDSVVPVGTSDFILNDQVRDRVRARVTELCEAFPLPSASTPAAISAVVA